MSQLPAEIWLTPEAEAERLWRGAQDAYQLARGSVVHLSEALDLGIRVVEILTVTHLQPVRREFATTLVNLLDSLPPEVDADRDFLNPPKSLRFVDALDMLSDADLPCISPQLHHGWEDHRQSCRRSRARTKSVTDISLDATQREALMLMGAYRNRIFRTPPPVRVIPSEVLDAFPVLVDLVDRLLSRNPDRQDATGSTS